MSSVAQIEANRRNAQKSTGPRTPEGKARVAANAIRHGVLCEKAFIDGEDPELFAEHCRSVKESLAPVGAIEETLADRVAAQAWRLRRATGIEGLFLHRELGQHGLLEDEYASGARRRAALAAEPLPPEDEHRSKRRGRAVFDFFHQGGVRNLDVLRRYERSIDQALHQALQDLMTLQDARRKAAPAELPRGKALVEAIARDPEASRLLRQFAHETFAEARRAAIVESAAVPSQQVRPGDEPAQAPNPTVTPPGPSCGESPDGGRSGITTKAQPVVAQYFAQDARKAGIACETKPISRDPSRLEELVRKVEQAEDDMEEALSAAAAGV